MNFAIQNFYIIFVLELSLRNNEQLLFPPFLYCFIHASFNFNLFFTLWKMNMLIQCSLLQWQRHFLALLCALECSDDMMVSAMWRKKQNNFNNFEFQWTKIIRFLDVLWILTLQQKPDLFALTYKSRIHIHITHQNSYNIRLPIDTCNICRYIRWYRVNVVPSNNKNWSETVQFNAI